MYNTISNQQYQAVAYNTNRNPSYGSLGGLPQYKAGMYDNGYNAGYTQGYWGGAANNYNNGYQTGYHSGYTSGYDHAYRQPTYVANNGGWGGLGAGIQIGPFSAGIGFGNILNGLLGGIGSGTKYW